MNAQKGEPRNEANIVWLCHVHCQIYAITLFVVDEIHVACIQSDMT